MVQDVNGYRWNLVQTASHHGPQTPERIIAVGITVPDVALAISWCVQVLGMLPLQQYTSLSGALCGRRRRRVFWSLGFWAGAYAERLHPILYTQDCLVGMSMHKKGTETKQHHCTHRVYDWTGGL